MHMVWHKLDIHGQAPEKLRRIPGRFEMRVARPHFRFSTVENRVTSTLHRCERKRIVSKLLAPSNYRSPTLSETVRRCGHSPITVSQRSRICHINFHAHACKTSEGPKANRKQTAHAIAPSLSHTLADSARQPVQPLHRFSMVQNLSHRPPMPQHGCKHRCVTGYRRSPNCSRRRAIALPHSRRLCAPAGAAPFLNGPKSVPSSARINVCSSVGVAGYRRSANCPRRRAIALSWNTPVRRSGSPHPGLTLPPRSPTVHLHHPGPTPRGRETKGQKIACAITVALPGTLADCARQPAHSRYRLSMVENLALQPPAPACVQGIGETGYPRSVPAHTWCYVYLTCVCYVYAMKTQPKYST